MKTLKVDKFSEFQLIHDLQGVYHINFLDLEVHYEVNYSCENHGKGEGYDIAEPRYSQLEEYHINLNLVHYKGV